MIELIEAPVSSEKDGSRKSLIILLSSNNNKYILDDAIILKSIKLYPRISNKRWKLIDKFKREGCVVKVTRICVNPERKYRGRYKMSLEDIVKMGKIEDNEILKKLRELDL